jgi:vacuolar protein sorting-associated protein 13A/C
MADQQGNKLMLKLHYHTYPNSGKAFKVQIYSPYIFLNKTGLPFDLAAKTWTGDDLFANDWQHSTPTPFMFGYPHEDRRNRLYLKVGDTKWSKPLSFEPVAADMQIVLGSNSGDKDTYVGLSYSEGLGKYKLTKVITIAPRFMLKNMFEYPLRIRQHSAREDIVVKKGETVPIHELSHNAPAQMTMAFDETTLLW